MHRVRFLYSLCISFSPTYPLAVHEVDGVDGERRVGVLGVVVLDEDLLDVDGRTRPPLLLELHGLLHVGSGRALGEEEVQLHTACARCARVCPLRCWICACVWR